ncbi:hypothetical protein HHK36_019787 [Tetracentron sinense]|uniref:Uncharacterized protein n=1 Tax=Tetracentron sinense TaxID=13715 RepID=A0A835D9X2_TETSI|nr:hypothetical protein HHK36_019787 [Tetracentron sinense]
MGRMIEEMESKLRNSLDQVNSATHLASQHLGSKRPSSSANAWRINTSEVGPAHDFIQILCKVIHVHIQNRKSGLIVFVLSPPLYLNMQSEVSNLDPPLPKPQRKEEMTVKAKKREVGNMMLIDRWMLQKMLDAYQLNELPPSLLMTAQGHPMVEKKEKSCVDVNIDCEEKEEED